MQLSQFSGRDNVAAGHARSHARDSAHFMQPKQIIATNDLATPRDRGWSGREEYLRHLAEQHLRPSAHNTQKYGRGTHTNTLKRETKASHLHPNNDPDVYSASAVRMFTNADVRASNAIRQRTKAADLNRNGRTMDNGLEFESTSTGVNVVIPYSKTEYIMDSIKPRARNVFAEEANALLATHKWHDWGSQTTRYPAPRLFNSQTGPAERGTDTRLSNKNLLRKDRSSRTYMDASNISGYSTGPMRTDTKFIRNGKNRDFRGRIEQSTSGYSLDQRGANIGNRVAHRRRGDQEVQITRMQYSQNPQNVHSDQTLVLPRGRDTTHTTRTDYEVRNRTTLGTTPAHLVARQQRGNDLAFVTNRETTARDSDNHELMQRGLSGTRGSSQRRFKRDGMFTRYTNTARRSVHTHPVDLDAPATRRDADYLHDDQPL